MFCSLVKLKKKKKSQRKWHVAPLSQNEKLHGKIAIPPSKSQTLRSILFASMAKGSSTIYSPLFSPDTFAMIDACRKLGAQIQVSQEDLNNEDNDHCQNSMIDALCKRKGMQSLTNARRKIQIEGIKKKIPLNKNLSKLFIDAKNSGQVLRFIMAIAALFDRPTTLTGDRSLCFNRTHTPLVEALQQLGASCQILTKDAFAPIKVCGPIKPGIVQVEGRDSQMVSALLIASCFLKGTWQIHVKNLGEIPWVHLTLSWLDKFHVKYENKNFEKITVYSKGSIDSFSYRVPGDFSTAAFLAVAAIITKSSITLENIDFSDNQGDRKVFAWLIDMGASICISEKRKTLIIKRSLLPLIGREIDIDQCIDALPILAVLGCYTTGVMRLKNASMARRKESDRLASITKELRKMGANIVERKEELIIYSSQLKGASLDSHNDHRIALSLSIAALEAKGESTIGDVECVDKTFPHFASEMRKIGAAIIEEED